MKLEQIKGVGPKILHELNNCNISSVEDLLFKLPIVEFYNYDGYVILEGTLRTGFTNNQAYFYTKDETFIISMTKELQSVVRVCKKIKIAGKFINEVFEVKQLVSSLFKKKYDVTIDYNKYENILKNLLLDLRLELPKVFQNVIKDTTLKEIIENLHFPTSEEKYHDCLKKYLFIRVFNFFSVYYFNQIKYIKQRLINIDLISCSLNKYYKNIICDKSDKDLIFDLIYKNIQLGYKIVIIKNDRFNDFFDNDKNFTNDYNLFNSGLKPVCFVDDLSLISMDKVNLIINGNLDFSKHLEYNCDCLFIVDNYPNFLNNFNFLNGVIISKNKNKDIFSNNISADDFEKIIKESSSYAYNFIVEKEYTKNIEFKAYFKEILQKKEGVLYD